MLSSIVAEKELCLRQYETDVAVLMRIQKISAEASECGKMTQRLKQMVTQIELEPIKQAAEALLKDD